VSSNLYWLPVVPEEGNALDIQLKFTLRKRFHTPVAVNFRRVDIPYLTGLADAGIDGAKELIEAIEKHSIIKVYEEY